MCKKFAKPILTLLCASLLFILPATTFAGTLFTSDAIYKLEMNGDLRIRYEYKEKDVDNEDPVDRLRQRFRLGMNWNNSDENWKVAAGLATGPVDATSTNQTYSEQKFFDKGNISLDYAYAEHKISDNYKFIAGQQKNPFETSWMLWDTDVRPAGFTAQVVLKPLFITAGYYEARYIDNDIAELGAIQTGVKMDMVTAALAYYHLGRTDEILKDLKVTNVDPDYSYDVVDLYVAGNIKAEPVTIKPYAQTWYNAGAKGDAGQSVLNGTPGGAVLDPEATENDLAWQIGIESKVDQFTASVDYTQVGSESCVQGLKDADFGADLNSTDVQGFKIGLGYSVTKNCSVAATAFFYEAKERDIDQNSKLYQFDLNYKF